MSPGDERRSPPARRLGDAARALWPAALMAVAFGHSLAMSWRCWGNLTVDGGRELQLPRSLLEGGSLYVTVRNLYGPLPAWLNAGLYAVFGTHADVLVWAGIATAAAMMAGLYFLGRAFVGRLEALVAPIWFAYACAFARLVENPSFNFAIPYSYAAIYGITAATWSLVFAVRHVRGRRDRDLWISVGLAAVTAGCKLEPLLAVGAAHATLLAGAIAARTLSARQLGAYAVGGAGVAGLYGVLAARVGASLWTDNMLSAANASVRAYALATLGLDELGPSLLAAAGSALLVAGGVALGAVVAFCRGRWASDPRVAWGVAALAAGALLAVAIALPLEEPLRALPFVAIAAFLALAIRFVRDPAARPEALPRLVLWAFALGCLSRLGLRAVPYHYGFYLMPVPVAAFVVTVCAQLPGIVGLRPWPRIAALPGVAVLAGVAVSCATESAASYRLHGVALETSRVNMRLLPNDPAALGVALLRALPPGSRVLAVPGGAGIVFAAGRRWADPSFAFFPTDLVAGSDDDALVRRWGASPPDAILYVPTGVNEFGLQGFGVDYALRAAAWINANYRPASDPSAPAVLFRRR